jgi:type II secretion system protein H
MTQLGDHSIPRRAFTLVELILVMALLAIVMALSAPSLSRSMRDRHLGDQAVRFLAAIEYARAESISQGIPVAVWVDPAAGHFGVQAKAGFSGDVKRDRAFVLEPDIRIELTNAASTRGVIEALSFQPDGTPEVGSVEAVRMIDRFASEITIARTADALGYEIVTTR